MTARDEANDSAAFEDMEDMEDDSVEGTQFVQNDRRTGDVYAVTYKKETLQQLTNSEHRS